MFTFLDVNFFSGSFNEITRKVENWIKNKNHQYICVTGLHGVIESQKDRRLMDVHNQSGLTVTDGMPLVWIGKILGHPETQRIYGPELFWRLLEFSEKKKYRIFLYGTTEETLFKLISKIKKEFPKLKIAGKLAPPFGVLSKKEDDYEVSLLNNSRAKIIFVGLSTPKQEKWMSTHLRDLKANVLVGVGAAFDFLSGNLHNTPLWMQNLGLEWLYRAVHEPRLLSRYSSIIFYLPYFLFRNLFFRNKS